MKRVKIDPQVRLKGHRFTVQRQWRKCSCSKCKEGGAGHGYFYYAYYYQDGRMHGVYLGKTLPEWISQAKE